METGYSNLVTGNRKRSSGTKVILYRSETRLSEDSAAVVCTQELILVSMIVGKRTRAKVPKAF
jgi:hypothetical protein